MPGGLFHTILPLLAMLITFCKPVGSDSHACVRKCMIAHLCIMTACKEHPQGRSEHMHSLPALAPCNPPGYSAGRWSGASR